VNSLDNNSSPIETKMRKEMTLGVVLGYYKGCDDARLCERVTHILWDNIRATQMKRRVSPITMRQTIDHRGSQRCLIRPQVPGISWMYTVRFRDNSIRKWNIHSQPMSIVTVCILLSTNIEKIHTRLPRPFYTWLSLLHNTTAFEWMMSEKWNSWNDDEQRRRWIEWEWKYLMAVQSP
jgi:hypothetical protein